MTDMRTTLGPGASSDLVWIADVLWGGVDGIGVTLEQPPSGTDVLERYRVVPNARAPRVLVPAERATGAGALAAGAGTRSGGARLGRRAAAAVIGAGMGGTFFRDQLLVYGAPGAQMSLAAPRGQRLAAALEELLEVPVSLVVNVRPPSPSRKPVVQVVDGDGATLAYAKVGWNTATDERLAAEAIALSAMAGSAGTVVAPRLREAGAWGGHRLVVSAPLPASIRRWRAASPPPVAATREVVERLGSTGSSTYAESPVRERLRATWEDAARTGADPALAVAIGDLLDALDRVSGIELEHGGWHGDWSPWNLGIDDGGVVAWDWEHAGYDVPAGLDLPHFCFQRAFIGARRSVAEAFGQAREAGAVLLRAFGCRPEQIELTLGVHVAEVGLRYLGAAVRGAPANPRFAADGAAAVAAEAARRAGPAS
ncbi:MAG: hypothetical protein ABI572_11495 [Actinomycetota bacterium]